MVEKGRVQIRERITRHAKGVLTLYEEALLDIPDGGLLVDALREWAVKSRLVLIELRKEETSH